MGLSIASDKVVWLKSLYIAQKFQGRGFGSMVMDMLEDIVQRQPLCATTILLDTVRKEEQMSPDFATAIQGYLPRVLNSQRPAIHSTIHVLISCR